MSNIFNLELPYDVVVVTSDNDSIFIVLLFSSADTGYNFYKTLMFNKELILYLKKESDDRFSFIFESSASSQIIKINTKRTLKNNPNLNKLLDESYLEYSYLTYGYLNSEQLLYNSQNSYPLFVKYLKD
jgi:hypothetical protein